MSDFKKLLSEAQLPKRVVEICLRGDLHAELQLLDQELIDFQRTKVGSKRLSGATTERDLSTKIGELQDQMRESSIPFELSAFNGRRWRELKAKHPVNEKPSPMDSVLGADAKGLLNEAVREAIQSPVLDDEDWEALTEKITDGEWQRLCETVYSLNEEGVTVPFSQRASLVMRQQGDASK